MNPKQSKLYHASRESNIKKLEIAALSRCIEDGTRILEAGCGTGINLFALREKFPNCILEGFDIDSEAIRQAYTENLKQKAGISFTVANMLRLPDNMLNPHVDIVITDRCLINLRTEKLQRRAITNIHKMLKPGGKFLMVENSEETFNNQNKIRKTLGLQPRKHAPFNKFISLKTIEWMSQNMFNLKYGENFGSLHDLMLYCLIPLIEPNHNQFDKWAYDNALVNAVTKLSIQDRRMGDFSPPLGQGHLWVLEKK